jgi:hypothetical protein
MMKQADRFKSFHHHSSIKTKDLKQQRRGQCSLLISELMCRTRFHHNIVFVKIRIKTKRIENIMEGWPRVSSQLYFRYFEENCQNCYHIARQFITAYL